MSTATWWLVAILFALIAGMGIGYEIGSGIAAKKEVATASKETKAVVNDVDKQAAAQHADEVAQQQASQQLAVDQSSLTDWDHTLHVEIDNAQFQSKDLPPQVGVVPVCSAPDPVHTPDFVRLYHAATLGESPPATASTGAR
ncbi:hypothetical protein [Dyella sp.]|jgi:hypothetical protein|uniref:hypothetical protein n=1 Tax=Dyella sp. TaxID=1869338 RepID=UPI002FD885C4